MKETILLYFAILSWGGLPKITNSEKNEAETQKTRMLLQHKYIFWQLREIFKSIATLTRSAASTQ